MPPPPPKKGFEKEAYSLNNLLNKDELSWTNTASDWLPGTAWANTNHFWTGFAHSNFHLLCAAAVAGWAKFDLHGLLILLLTLQAVCYCLDHLHPFLPDPEGSRCRPRQIESYSMSKWLSEMKSSDCVWQTFKTSLVRWMLNWTVQNSGLKCDQPT